MGKSLNFCKFKIVYKVHTLCTYFVTLRQVQKNCNSILMSRNMQLLVCFFVVVVVVFCLFVCFVVFFLSFFVCFSKLTF